MLGFLYFFPGGMVLWLFLIGSYFDTTHACLLGWPGTFTMDPPNPEAFNSPPFNIHPSVASFETLLLPGSLDHNTQAWSESNQGQWDWAWPLTPSQCGACPHVLCGKVLLLPLFCSPQLSFHVQGPWSQISYKLFSGYLPSHYAVVKNLLNP